MQSLATAMAIGAKPSALNSESYERWRLTMPHAKLSDKTTLTNTKGRRLLRWREISVRGEL